MIEESKVALGHNEETERQVNMTNFNHLLSLRKSSNYYQNHIFQFTTDGIIRRADYTYMNPHFFELIFLYTVLWELGRNSAMTVKHRTTVTN